MITKDDCINSAINSPSVLKVLPKAYKADKDVVRAALVRPFYEYYEEPRYSDDVIVFKILENFKYADSKLKNDKHFVLELIEKCSGYIYKYLPAKLKNDKDILLAVSKKIGFDYIGNRLNKSFRNKNSFYDEVYEIGLRQFLESNRISPFIGPKLLGDKKLMMKVLLNEPMGIFNMSDEMKNDKEIAKLVLGIDVYCINAFSDEIKDNEEIIKAAIFIDEDVLEFASERLQLQLK